MKALRRFLAAVRAWRVWREVLWDEHDAAVWARFAASPTGIRFAEHIRNSALRASCEACADPKGGEWARGYAAGMLHASAVIDALTTATPEPESGSLREPDAVTVGAAVATAG